MNINECRCGQNNVLSELLRWHSNDIGLGDLLNSRLANGKINDYVKIKRRLREDWQNCHINRIVGNTLSILMTKLTNKVAFDPSNEVFEVSG